MTAKAGRSSKLRSRTVSTNRRVEEMRVGGWARVVERPCDGALNWRTVAVCESYESAMESATGNYECERCRQPYDAMAERATRRMCARCEELIADSAEHRMEIMRGGGR